MPGWARGVADPMSDLTMPADVREAFVADPRVGVLSIAREAGAAPLSTPVWYLYEPGGEVIITIGRDSEKARLLDASPTASMCVQTETAPLPVRHPLGARRGRPGRTRRCGARSPPATSRPTASRATSHPVTPTRRSRSASHPTTWFTNDYSRSPDPSASAVRVPPDGAPQDALDQRGGDRRRGRAAPRGTPSPGPFTCRKRPGHAPLLRCRTTCEHAEGAIE